MRESSTVPVCGRTAVTLNCLAEHVERVAVLEPELGGHVGPDEDFVVFQGLDDPLAGQRLLVVRSHHADRGPAADGPREDARTAPGGLGLKLALRQDAREREGLALQFDRHRQLRREVVEPRQVRHRQLRDVFLGNRLALHVGRVVVLQAWPTWAAPGHWLPGNPSPGPRPSRSSR